MSPRLGWRSLFERGKQPLIGMIHLHPLPGSPGFQGSMAAIIAAARHDAEAIQNAGLDAILFVNEGDAPFPLEAPQESLAAMAAVVQAARPSSIPFGVEMLFDPQASLSIAAATEASFIRAGMAGVWEGTSGLRCGDAASVLRRRTHLGLRHVGIFGVAQAELAWPLSTMPDHRRIALAAREAAMDVILVGGDPGQSADDALVSELRAVAGEIPVLANSGVKLHNLAAVLELYDGCLIGTALRQDDDLSKPVDPARASQLTGLLRRPGDN